MPGKTSYYGCSRKFATCETACGQVAFLRKQDKGKTTSPPRYSLLNLLIAV